MIEESAVAKIETELGVLKLLLPTDCVKDRLANYIHFHDRQCLQQTIMVAQQQPVDFNAIHKWCENEKSIYGYEDFMKGLKQTS